MDRKTSLLFLEFDEIFLEFGERDFEGRVSCRKVCEFILETLPKRSRPCFD
jgi:hypothetical protein